MIKKLLLDFGVNTNEINTYLKILELGKGRAQIIAEEVEIPRTTVYGHLNSLCELGLVRKGFDKGKPTYFAEPPNTIIDIQEKKLQSCKNLVNSLQEIYKKESSDSQVIFFEHKEGIYKLHEESLINNTNRLTRYIGDMSTTHESYGNRIDGYQKRRRDKGIRNQIISSEGILDLGDRYTKHNNKKFLREVKYLKGMKPLVSGLFNYGKTVWITPRGSSKFIIKIVSSEFAETYDNLFNFLWSLGHEV
ncbi:hypothetical protein GF362_06635 [Candidatus Dojkabacteria bacterium]|nr:hypothetical protein [Candidatus Dojkabacteria bacterium]